MRRLRGPGMVLAGVTSAGLVLAVGMLSFAANRRVVESGERVSSTRETLSHLRAIVSTIKDAETRQRGYLLTGDTAYLAPYDSAVGVIEAELRVLRDALTDTPPQLAQVDTLHVLAQAKLEELSSVVALRDTAGLAAAAGAVRTDEGRRLMNEIVRVAEAMEGAMNARLAMLQEEEAARTRTATVVIVIATIVAFGLALLASAVLIGALRALERAQGEQRVRIAQQVGLTAASTAVAAAPTREAMLEAVAHRIRDVIGAHRAVVMVIPKDGAGPESTATSVSEGFAGSSTMEIDGLDREVLAVVIRTNAPVRASSAELQSHLGPSGPDADAPERATRHPRRTRSRGFLAVPLTDRDGRNLGSIQLSGKYEGEFTEEDEAVALQLARMVSIAIENFRVFAEAQEARVDAERARVAAEEAMVAAERANAAKSDFLSTMSHEIRTPINAIIGYAELLELGISGPTTPDQQAQLARIRKSGRHLLGLVSDVLDLSKLESGRLELAREVGRAGDDADAALALLRPQAASKGIALEDECGGARSARYVGDPQRARQILVNLISNAIKFTEPGGRVAMRCATRRGPIDDTVLDGAGPWVGFEVEDTGVGMGPAELRRIFQPFTQATSGLTRTQGGVGLGLTISRRLARQMGGDLTVRSERGRGSCFTLWLSGPEAPARAPDAGLDAGRDSEEQPASAGDLEVVGAAMLGDLDAIVAEFVDRLRRDPALPRARGLDDTQLADHTPAFLSDIAQSLVILHAAGAKPALMRDSSEIQRVISERHGAQRHRIGWTEPEVAREFQILRQVVFARVAGHAGRPEHELSGAFEVLGRFLDQSERISRAGLRHALAVAER